MLAKSVKRFRVPPAYADKRREFGGLGRAVREEFRRSGVIADRMAAAEIATLDQPFWLAMSVSSSCFNCGRIASYENWPSDSLPRLRLT